MAINFTKWLSLNFICLWKWITFARLLVFQDHWVSYFSFDFWLNDSLTIVASRSFLRKVSVFCFTTYAQFSVDNKAGVSGYIATHFLINCQHRRWNSLGCFSMSHVEPNLIDVHCMFIAAERKLLTNGTAEDLITSSLLCIMTLSNTMRKLSVPFVLMTRVTKGNIEGLSWFWYKKKRFILLCFCSACACNAICVKENFCNLEKFVSSHFQTPHFCSLYNCSRIFTTRWFKWSTSIFGWKRESESFA